MLEVLSNLDEYTTECGSGTDSFFRCVFKQFDHRGFVLNVEEFPGTIQIEGSSFKQNMAFIKDYLVHVNDQADSYLTPSTIKYSQFELQSGQLNFKVCNLISYTGEYLVQQMADPEVGFADDEFV